MVSQDTPFTSSDGSEPIGYETTVRAPAPFHSSAPSAKVGRSGRVIKPMKTNSGSIFGGSQSKMVLGNDKEADSQPGSDENQGALDMAGLEKDKNKGIDNGKGLGTPTGDIEHGSHESTTVVAAAASSVSLVLHNGQIDFSAALKAFENLSLTELDNASTSADQVKMLISEVKARKGLPGGEFCSFMSYPKLPIEIKHMIWKEAAREVQEVVIQAYMVDRGRHPMLALNFKCFGKRDTLPSVCLEAQTAIRKVRNVRIGPQLPGFKGVVRLNGIRDLLIVQHDSTARDNECVLAGVENVVVDRRRGALDEVEFAHYLRKMFPDLQCFYIMSSDGRRSRAVADYIKHPKEYALVPENSTASGISPQNITTWSQTWLSAENIYQLRAKHCPQVKMMRVVKRAGN